MASHFRISFLISVLAVSLFSVVGCEPPPAKEDKKPAGGSVIGKTTSEIGEWDPNGGQKVRETEEANLVNHLRVGVEGVLNGSASMMVERGLQLYQAETGRFPETFEEFKTKVFDVYIQQLPAPLTSCEYQYDVKNHRLVVVEKKKE